MKPLPEGRNKVACHKEQETSWQKNLPRTQSCQTEEIKGTCSVSAGKMKEDTEEGAWGRQEGFLGASWDKERVQFPDPFLG